MNIILKMILQSFIHTITQNIIIYKNCKKCAEKTSYNLYKESFTFIDGDKSICVGIGKDQSRRYDL